MATRDNGRIMQDLRAAYPNLSDGELRAIDRRWRAIAAAANKPGGKYI